MSFGFSVGDFIAVGKLAGEIISSLQTVGGAKSEYQELIRELQSLQTALRYLDRLDDTKSPSKHVQSIKCAALACTYPLESFFAKVKKYETSLGLWSRSNTAKTAKHKLRWSFGEKGEIVRLRAYLTMHIETINNMLIQHGLERMDLLGKEVEESTSQLQSKLDNTKTALENIQKDSAGQAVMLRTMQSMLGTLCKVVCGEIKTTIEQLSHVVTTVCASTQQIYTVVLEIRDSVTSVDTRFTYFQAPYQVEDARGFVFPVPSEYSLDELENIIIYKFRMGAGALDVQQGNYELCNTKRRSKRVMSTDDLRPGMAITMAIIITKSITGGHDSICPMPRCESSDIAANPGGGFRWYVDLMINLEFRYL
ncbi:hypothetical protein IQ06DRAFT_22129 [Phaeosphaeriaceae sp. SRC1lsM3a]|nr:hypothetical protein IQ06DRAFT_22129 [Stagonospora sp. SRC1lsM3a]